MHDEGTSYESSSRSTNPKDNRCFTEKEAVRINSRSRVSTVTKVPSYIALLLYFWFHCTFLGEIVKQLKQMHSTLPFDTYVSEQTIS